MGSFRKYGVTVVLSVILIVTASWGFLIHKTVHQLAVYTLPKEMVPFFYQHMDYLVNNAPRPDQRRNTDSTEAPNILSTWKCMAPMRPIPCRWIGPPPLKCTQG
jgi:hypothetical protein